MTSEERKLLLAMANGVSSLCYKFGYGMDYAQINEAVRDLAKRPTPPPQQGGVA